MDLDHEAVVQHCWKTHGSWCSCGCQLTDPLEHPCRSNAPHCSTSTPRFQWSLSRTVCAAKLQILLCHTLRNLAKRIRCPLMANWLKWTMTGKKMSLWSAFGIIWWTLSLVALKLSLRAHYGSCLALTLAEHRVYWPQELINTFSIGIHVYQQGILKKILEFELRMVTCVRHPVSCLRLNRNLIVLLDWLLPSPT